MNEIIKIKTEYITLGQFLKYANIIQSGGHTKFFLEETIIKVNGTSENRRGKKLYKDDIIEIDGHGSFIIDITEDN